MSADNSADEDISSTTTRRRRSKVPLLRMPSPLEEIRMSCLKGNFDSVQQLIESGASSANEVFEDGWSALMVCCNVANPTLVKYLLAQGADPTFRRADGFSALMTAITSSQKDTALVHECVELLLKAGSDVNCQSDTGQSPLQLAIKDNRVPVVNLLISAGANINLNDNDERTPIIVAIERGLGDVVQILLKKGADVNIKFKGKRLFQYARSKGHMVIADTLRRAEAASRDAEPGKSIDSLNSDSEKGTTTTTKKPSQLNPTNADKISAGPTTVLSVPIKSESNAESKNEIKNTAKHINKLDKDESVPALKDVSKKSSIPTTTPIPSLASEAATNGTITSELSESNKSISNLNNLSKLSSKPMLQETNGTNPPSISNVKTVNTKIPDSKRIEKGRRPSMVSDDKKSGSGSTIIKVGIAFGFAITLAAIYYAKIYFQKG